MFLQLLWLKSRALELVPRNDVFATFASKIGLFSLETVAKAHTKLQQGKTSMNKPFLFKKDTIENFFHAILRKSDTSGLRYLRRLFSQHPDQLERNGLDCRQRQQLFYLSTQFHPAMSSVGEMREESREHSFRLIYQSDGMWFNHQFHISYISANH